MRWHADDGDGLDTLEPLDPGSDQPLPGFDSDNTRSARSEWSEVPPLSVVRPRDPKAMRLWLLAAGLGAMSALQFAAAGYVRGVEGDLRHLEEAWRVAVAIDADREAADRALIESTSQYGVSPGVDDQRDLLYDAANARFGKVVKDVAAVGAGSGPVQDLKRDMLRALNARRADFRHERVPLANVRDLDKVTAKLDATLRRWRIDRDAGEESQLTAARELIERLDRMADEPTGLTIVAIARHGVFLIDVDENQVRSTDHDLSRDATVHPTTDGFVIVDGGRARAFSAEPDSPVRWEAAADIGVSAGDEETVWLQHGTTLRRVDPAGSELSTTEVPPGARVVAASTPARALVYVPDHGLMVTTEDGRLIAAGQRRRLGDGQFGTNGSYAAVLDDRGRVLVARLDEGRGRAIFSALRAELPAFIDLAVID
jgi:hypothetical protein